MRKRYVATAVGAISTGLIASYWLRDQSKRNAIKGKLSGFKRTILGENQDEHVSTLEEAGVPDQIDTLDPTQIENANMVSEGSQYGVSYYNKVQEEESRKIDH